MRTRKHVIQAHSSIRRSSPRWRWFEHQGKAMKAHKKAIRQHYLLAFNCHEESQSEEDNRRSVATRLQEAVDVLRLKTEIGNELQVVRSVLESESDTENFNTGVLRQIQADLDVITSGGPFTRTTTSPFSPRTVPTKVCVTPQLKSDLASWLGTASAHFAVEAQQIESTMTELMAVKELLVSSKKSQ